MDSKKEESEEPSNALGEPSNMLSGVALGKRRADGLPAESRAAIQMTVFSLAFDSLHIQYIYGILKLHDHCAIDYPDLLTFGTFPSHVSHVHGSPPNIQPAVQAGSNRYSALNVPPQPVMTSALRK